MPRSVQLLAEHREDGSSIHLSAELTVDGDLRISGHDLGPVTAMVSPDGEYEYWYTVQAHDVPALAAALGGEADEEILDVLEDKWSGRRAHGLYRAMRQSAVPFVTTTYS